MVPRGSQGIASLLEKMSSPDADFRYMALSDLIASINADNFSAAVIDERTESAVVHKVLDLIKDHNGEVKNMSVKCLGALVKTAREVQMQVVLDKLVEYLSSKEEELRDIASLGLKTIMAEIPAGSSVAANTNVKLVPRLLNQVNDMTASQELVIDSLDILSDYFVRFSHLVSNDVPLQHNAQKTLLTALQSNRAAIRKRAVTALSALAASAISEVFTDLAEAIALALSKSKTEVLRTFVQLLGALSKTCPRRLGRRMPEFMPRILDMLSSEETQEDDELREAILQALDSIILRCPTEVTPFILPAAEASVSLLRHDPNYAGGDSDDEMAFDDDMEADDDILDEEEYSDDEDLSWKVRRASAKLLATIVTTRPELLSTMTSNVAPALVARFSEREESVRNEILHTFNSLLQQVQTHGFQPQATEVLRNSPGSLKRKWDTDAAIVAAEGSPVSQIRSLEPTIAKALSSNIVSKSLQSRVLSFIVLQELTKVLHGGLDAHIGLFVGQLDKITRGADANSGPTTNLKIEILIFLQLLFRFHSVENFDSYLDQLVVFITSAIGEKTHRDTIEGLKVTAELVRIMCPLDPKGSDISKAYTRQSVLLYNATVARLTRTDSDQEIKEKSIETLGVLISRAGDQLSDHYHEALPLLLEQIRNEVTRYAAVHVTTDVAASSACTGPEIDNFVRAAIVEVSALLRKNNRLLRLASFDCLNQLLKRVHTSITQPLADNTVREIEPLLAYESNLNLFPTAFDALQLLIPSAIGSIQEVIVPRLHSIVLSPLLQGKSLVTLLRFLEALLAADTSLTSAILDLLRKANTQAQKSPNPTHVYSTVAQCIGATAKTVPEICDALVEEAKATLKTQDPDSDIYFQLHVTGEIGRIRDLSSDKNLLETVFAQYDAATEEVKGAAAFAVGNMAVGNLPAFLPIIETGLRDEKNCRLSLLAIKELITHGSSQQLENIAEEVWDPLFDICATKDEAIRNIGAECLARLTLTQPHKYFSRLQSRIHDPLVSTRASVVSAFRFILTDSTSKYDELLAPNIIDFLSVLTDESLEVRKPAMFAFNAAAHNRPNLIRNHLDVLMPMLYQETMPRPELLRKVAMGPFTVTTDDGLDLRKNAFETMYTLLDTCFAKINLTEYVEHVVAGLKDEDGIKVLCCLMLVRLASLAPTQISQHLDDVVEPITSTLKVKLKDQATKQDVEKSAELQRSLFRAMVALDKTPHSAPKFQALKRDARNSSPLYRDVEASFHVNTAGQRDLLGFSTM